MTKKKQAIKPKEKCPSCSSTQFSISLDKMEKRFCMKCGKVWLPTSEEGFKIQLLEEENLRLKERLAAEQRNTKSLTLQNEKLKKALGLDPTIQIRDLEEEEKGELFR